jgi:uncharacterized membrane protein (DUF4010 family)
VSVEELFQRLAVALAIGLLVGLERGWKLREEAEGQRAAGLRTFALVGLLGGVAAVLSEQTAPITLGLTGIAFTIAFTLFHWLESRQSKDVSVTGVVAGILTFSLGAYAVLGELQVAIAAAVAMTLLLALKQPLHAWIERLSWLEIRAALTLLAMSFLLLPVLPDKAVDPWGAINPTQIWLFAIMIAAVSFVGYVAVKLAGERAGVAFAGLAGGLASSTATTLTFARLARESPAASGILAGGILLSAAVMVTRVAVIAGIVNPGILPPLAAPIAAAALVFAATAAVLLRRGGEGSKNPDLKLDNPFDLGTALKFAALIAVVMLAARLVTAFAGERGLYALAAASGLVDVDAITLSLSRLAEGEITPMVASIGIAIAAAVNSLVKIVLVFTAGPRQLGVMVTIATALALAAGAAAFLLAPVLA